MHFGLGQRHTDTQHAAMSAGLDTNGDELIPDPDPNSARRQSKNAILVYSAGPDGDYSTWDDNIKTW